MRLSSTWQEFQIHEKGNCHGWGSRIPLQDPAPGSRSQVDTITPFFLIRKVKFKETKHVAQVTWWGFKAASYPLPRGSCPRASPSLPPSLRGTHPPTGGGAQGSDMGPASEPALLGATGKLPEELRKSFVQSYGQKGSPPMASRVTGPSPALCLSLVSLTSSWEGGGSPLSRPHTEASSGASRRECGAETSKGSGIRLISDSP